MTDAALVFPTSASPIVSIVIPVHNHVDTTLACLRSVMRHTRTHDYEVVVADDASTDATAAVLSDVNGLIVVRLASNVGFQDAVTAGIQRCRGEFVFLLNNDTEVTAGWLEPLMDLMSCDPTIGAVGSKLVFPDGRLQEAGSIVWRDGSAWNIGYGADPDAPQFNYVRDVDYCSAAALLVRRSAFDVVGGFDSRFKPAYYEDTDLCFSLRAAGYRVVYQPESVVIHQGSLSHATDPGSPRDMRKQLLMDTHQRLFAAKWALELERHWTNGTSRGYRGGRIDRRPRVVVGDDYVPAHDRDSGGLRMTSILRLLVELGCHVTFIPEARERRDPYTQELQQLGIEVYWPGWDEEIERRQDLYDLVILSRPGNSYAALPWALRNFPHARVVYDTVDLHLLREERRLGLGHQVDPVARRQRGMEMSLLRSCDLVATVTEEERLRVLELVPKAKTVVLPNVHSIRTTPVPTAAGRDGMVFIGGFGHPPNADAVLWFTHDVLPRIREKLGEIHFTILGSDPSPEITRLASESITVTGYVADVDDYFDHARVFVAPLRYGAGLKGKVGQAMSLGLPVVTTSIGAEGFGLIDGEHALVRDTAEAFAAAVVEVASNDALWNHLSQSARQLIDGTLSPAAMRQRLAALLYQTTGYVAPKPETRA